MFVPANGTVNLLVCVSVCSLLVCFCVRYFIGAHDLKKLTACCDIYPI